MQGLSSDGVHAGRETRQPPVLLSGLQAKLLLGHSLPLGSGELRPQVQRDELLPLIEAPKVLLLLCVHHDVYPANKAKFNLELLILFIIENCGFF